MAPLVPQPKFILQDIRSGTAPVDLYTAIKTGLTSTPKQLPSLLLWDADGHKLFESITKSESYYGTRADQDVMVEHMNQLCDMIGDDGILLELGCG
jgi:L-histidine N-alpha-methyltransferase